MFVSLHDITLLLFLSLGLDDDIYKLLQRMVSEQKREEPYDDEEDEDTIYAGLSHYMQENGITAVKVSCNTEVVGANTKPKWSIV